MCSSDLNGSGNMRLGHGSAFRPLECDECCATCEDAGNLDTEFAGAALVVDRPARSEERRGGKECRSRWARDH